MACRHSLHLQRLASIGAPDIEAELPRLAWASQDWNHRRQLKCTHPPQLVLFKLIYKEDIDSGCKMHRLAEEEHQYLDTRLVASGFSRRSEAQHESLCISASCTGTAAAVLVLRTGGIGSGIYANAVLD